MTTLTLGLDFVLIWTLILGVGVFFYVLLDGFDLGVGILFGLAPDTPSRNLAMNSIAPIWDGNETWLVLGSMGLLAAFPIAFAIIIPAVYFPILVMLLSLIFRGVAFEFRYRDREHRSLWDHGFNYGSVLATFAQGIVLGAFIQGFRTDGQRVHRKQPRLLHPVQHPGRRLPGVRLFAARRRLARAEDRGRDAVLGARTADGHFSACALPAGCQHLDADRVPRHSQPLVLVANFALLAPVPIVTAVVAWLEWRTLNRADSEAGPFIGAIALFAMSYLGLGISLFPYVVPHRLTLWQAASDPSTQVFLLIGTLFLLPVILMYTGWSYWVFRGKVRADAGYH